MHFPIRFVFRTLLFCFFPFVLSAQSWAQIRLKEMTLEEKIAQLFILPVWTEGASTNVDEIEGLIKKYSLGSIIFMQGEIKSQIQAYNRLQKISKLPLLVGQDNEWGLELRLKDGLRFPRNLTLGALQNKKLIYDLGKEIAHQCKAVGVHINFAPVVDVNNNPNNSVINDRSFGESPDEVATRGLWMMLGMQEGGVYACAKHFPGHGDTEIDSHLSLPVIHKSKEALHQVEWKPFKALIESNLSAIMTAHLLLPDCEPLYPSSLSPALVDTELKKNLGFKGLVITDSFQMKAISDHFEDGDSDVLALVAGNDLIIRFKHFEKALKRVETAVIRGEISEEEINHKVLKILKAKENFNLHKNRNLEPLDLFSKKALALKKQLFKEAITLVENQSLPALSPNEKLAFIQIGRDVLMKNAIEVAHSPLEEQYPKKLPAFYEALESELTIDFFFLPKSAEEKDVDRLLEKLSAYSKVVIGVFEMNKYSKLNYGIQESTLKFLSSLSKENKNLYIALFGSPYSLKFFENEPFLLMCYENDEDAQFGAAEILLGKQPPLGQLPITASKKYSKGHGISQSLKAF